MMACSKFVVTTTDAAADGASSGAASVGETSTCRLRFQAYDAMLGAGQRLADWESAAAAGLDCISDKALVGPVGEHGNVRPYGKWNVIGSEFRLFAPKSPTLGHMRVVVDGEHKATVDLYSAENVPSSPVYACTLNPGRHTIAVFPERGKIALDVVEVVMW
jgi:hypothetical protein